MLLLIKAKLNYAELMRNFSYKLLVIITDSIFRFSPGDGKLMHDAQSYSRKINMILLMTLAAMVTLFIPRDIFRTYVDTRHKICKPGRPRGRFDNGGIICVTE